MICNERQYRITKRAAARFRHALETLHERVDDDLPPLLRTAHEAAIKSQLADLEGDIAACEATCPRRNRREWR